MMEQFVMSLFTGSSHFITFPINNFPFPLTIYLNGIRFTWWIIIIIIIFMLINALLMSVPTILVIHKKLLLGYKSES